MSQTKVCKKCGIDKPTTNFSPLKTTANKLQTYCKECRRTHAKQKYKSDGVYREIKAQKRMDRHKRATYGISEAEYVAMLAKQQNKCTICNNLDPSGKRLAVDHCHTTGIIRGLLCCNCNRAIGMMQDSPDLLIKAAEYLKGAYEKHYDRTS